MMCSTCGREAEKYRKDSNQCKDCIYAKQNEWRAINADRIRGYANKRNKKYTESQKRAILKWREKNKEKYNDYHREYQRQLKEKDQ